jgi:hypothetical protein
MNHLAHHGIVVEQSSQCGTFQGTELHHGQLRRTEQEQACLERLLHFIVKRRIAIVARAIFLVRGHTKNACDRLFNTMKKQYRKVNSFTPEDLVASIRGNDKVDPFMVTDNVFKDWDKLENTLIKKIPGGNTTNNHIFTVDINRNNGNSMFIQERATVLWKRN